MFYFVRNLCVDSGLAPSLRVKKSRVGELGACEGIENEIECNLKHFPAQMKDLGDLRDPCFSVISSYEQRMMQ